MATITTRSPIPERAIQTRDTTSVRGVRFTLARQAHLIVLGLLTCAAAGLRFFALDRPTLWYDEAATFSRVNGSYYDLLEVLQFDGFPPIHYQLYWLLGQATYLDPFFMRLIPATAGVLMVPAMYFLARQLVSRQAALLAALLTLSSAWLMTHSRDAKMYMLTWLFITLALGGLFCWLRTDKRLAWLGWVFFALAAVGTHASALIIVAITPFFVLTAPRLRWSRVIYLAIGMAVVLTGPGGYYFFFNKWNQRTGGVFSGTIASQSRSAALVETVVSRTGNPEAITEAAGEFEDERAEFSGWRASGLDWIDRQVRGMSGPQVLRRSVSAYLTGWHWPKQNQIDATTRDGQPVIPRVVVYAVTTLLSVLAVVALLGLLPWSRRWSPKPAADHDIHPVRGPPEALSHDSASAGAERPALAAYRGATWLALWLVLPTYGFYYCRSIEDFVAPWHWLAVIGAVWGAWWTALLGGAAVLALGPLRWRWFRTFAVLTIAGFALWPLKPAITEGGWDWLSEYITRLLDPLTLGVLCVGLPALALYHAGGSWSLRAKRCGHFVYAFGVVFGLCCAAYLFWTWMAMLAENRGAIAWLAKEIDSPRSYEWKPLWMPRYLGIVWPALAVALAWLIMRLPGRPLRAGVIVALLGVNLGLAGARIMLDTEPRFDLMTADIWDASDEPDRVAAYFFNGHGGGAWRNAGGLRGYPGSYYLAAHKQIRPTPLEMRGGWIYGTRRRGNRVPERLTHQPPAIHFRTLPTQLQQKPDLQRLVVWTQYRPGEKPDTRGNPLLQETIGAQWQLKSDAFYRVISHKTWEQRNWHRRRVFERVPDEPIASVAPADQT